MIKNTLKRKRLIFVSAAICLVVALGALSVRWYQTYYLPMQRARPILKGLKSPSNTSEVKKVEARINGYRYDPEQEKYVKHKFEPLEGIAARKVEERVLEILATCRDPKTELEAVGHALGIVLTSSWGRLDMQLPETGLEFTGEDDWAIIKDAVEFYEKHDPNKRNSYEVETHQGEDGSVYYLTISHSMY